ncbi:vancomycin resistance protein VanW [Paenibacillus sp. 1_12]|uniref:VanW family protein n=1 Tax=Paenibacillus sp. 1_12 TaxID=1566278 RepID=UPI0008DF59CB|nr:VanW family protein [Paenibacillus sp. 1_12]SFM53405.1 vancomycin resistance protein VanW [Paenibacillus sp. 1_12]
MKKILLRYFPFLYRLRVQQLILKRHITNLNPSINYASEISNEKLSFICMKHKSVLRRVLGHSDPSLQENKINNLRIALQRVDGIMIKPGETFSYWRLVGKTTKKKGYIEGLMLSNGEVRTGIGGGLCQMANMLFWLALHTPLKIKERHHHSFDIFPDDRRIIPFGTGTSVFYNYVDLQFYNPTNYTFQFHLFLSDEYLEGRISSNKKLDYNYKVNERNHKFYQNENKTYRENEIWRLEISKLDNQLVHEELIIKNNAEVKYMKSNN